MKNNWPLSAVVATTVLASAAMAQQFAPAVTVAIPPARMAAAKEAGGAELGREVESLCVTSWHAKAHRDGSKMPAKLKFTLAEPRQVFDNLYWVGYKEIGAWILKTSKGLILLDSLNSTEDAEQVLVPQMTRLGLDPHQIKYVIVSHGHFDHFGGSAYLQRVYGARVAMGGPDWTYMAESRPFDPPFQAIAEKPKQDIMVRNLDRITVGDTTVTMFLTPGHTPGSLAMVFPVKSNGRVVKVVLIGGALPMQTRDNLGWFEQNLNRAAGAAGVVDIINSHPPVSDPNIRESLESGKPATPWGWDKVRRLLKAGAECTADQLSG